jgi:5-formyltetrahydrofolate cyclo-ligase
VSKKELRQHLRQILDGISPTELHDRSLLACHHLAQTREYERAEVIMVFLSLPTEVDTTSLVVQAWRDNKRVLAPKVSWEQRRMLPTEIRSLSDDVSESPLGIREPAQGMPMPVGSIDMVVVPGIGFDAQGNRIGRGRGFYDRFLAHRDWRGIACGLALKEQLVGEVPTTEHDMRVDLLATDAGIHRFSRRTPVRAT